MSLLNSPIIEASKGGVVLLLQVPRTNEKKELAAEQMFASLNGLLQGTGAKQLGGRQVGERVSFEIAVKNKRIGFYVWVPEYLRNYVEEQIYAQYPTVNISEVNDYILNDRLDYTSQLTAELKLSGQQALPIKTFLSFEVDPLAAITATLAQFDENEEAFIQFVMRPTSEKWYKKSEKYVNNIRSGKTTSSNYVISFLHSIQNNSLEKPVLAEYQLARANAAEDKSHKIAYELNIRLVYFGNNAPLANMRIKAMVASFKQFNTTYLNGFTQKSLNYGEKYVENYRNRTIKQGFVLNIEEVASLYHLPHTNVETPSILWANSKTAEPPANLPIIVDGIEGEVSQIATTNFRGHNVPFGLSNSDRGRHLYIIGQTGVGKSGLLELLTISDINNGSGFAVIDPHGDYAMNVLSRIPADRIKDVVYFNPADGAYPIAFNPMEVEDDQLKTHTCSELIGVLKRMFDSWGPRLEYILRYSILALLEYPNATMLDITRILTDKNFRKEVLEFVNDPVVRNFWQVEFASWNDRFATESIAPVLNKVGAFTANPIVRNIIGQPKSSFSIRSIMDERKILIVNLSRGLIGEDNASLLGALLVSKIQMAAMSRANIPQDQRQAFNLYVDEFQNFATDSFATILSEARKYSLNLTVANQYVAQMTQVVKDAVFGNVGSIIAFRMGADDALSMQRYFVPHFIDQDLVHLHNRHFAINMTIEGEKVPSFSGITLDLPGHNNNFTELIVENSRTMYTVERSSIEELMQARYVNKNYDNKISAVISTKLDVVSKPGLSFPKISIRDRQNSAIAKFGKLFEILTDLKYTVTQYSLIRSNPDKPLIEISSININSGTYKRKRKRNRKRKNNLLITQEPSSNSKSKIDETVIRLR
jgi:hypothetical protein